VKFLFQKGLEFVEKNVPQRQAALKELIDLGFQSTPMTIIDGQSIVGFGSTENSGASLAIGSA